MLLDPNQLDSVVPSRILNEVIQGRLDIDSRVLNALLRQPADTVRALLEVVQSGLWRHSADLEIDLAQLFHALEASEGVPFLIEAVRLHPEEIPDEVMEALHFFGSKAVEPLLALYEELDEERAEEVAFLLASLHLRDDRILKLLLDRLEYSAAEGAFLLGIYGDPAAEKHLQEVKSSLPSEDNDLKKELDEALRLLASQSEAVHEPARIDIYSRYPKEADLPMDLLSEDERLELLDDPRPAIRAEAAHSFFNQRPDDKAVTRLLELARSDSDEQVRSRAWEALVDATGKAEVLDAMLHRLREKDMPVAERAGLLVGLSFEADRNEVRLAMEDLYNRHPEIRAKILEAMWRSLHPAFRDKFAPHLDDENLEVRRSAVWGIGYYAIRPALDAVRKLLSDEDLRTDAIFAYSLALPNEISKGRVKALLKRIEKDAGGLTELEERLAMTALDERLMLAGKEPVFFPED
ncbi:MAG: HEAT repeat domain-containing protein [Bryobacteraceae bacterium]